MLNSRRYTIKSQSKKAIIFSLLWLLISAAYFYALIILLLTTNLFSWSLRFNFPTVITLFAIVILLVAVFFVARFTIGKIEIGLSLMASLAISLFGVYVLYGLYSETISSGFLSRRVLSPDWFRLSLFGLYLFPIICWLLYPYKVLINRTAVIK
jgi:hypothetical protein